MTTLPRPEYERTCFTAYPNPNRGPRHPPKFTVIEVEQCGPDEYDVWIESGSDVQWWYDFNDWMLSYITSPTWIGHHSMHYCTFMVSSRDAVLFKLMKTGWKVG